MEDVFSEGIVRFHLQQTCEKDGLRSFCRKHDLDPGNVSNIINGNKDMIDSVAIALGYRPVRMYRKP
jgi:hypothetical protein